MNEIRTSDAHGAQALPEAVPLRLVQVYLTPAIDEFLRQARSTAIMAGLDVSASAVVRHAMERLIATTSPAAMVELLGSPKGQSQPRRGRPRRLMHNAFANLRMHNSLINRGPLCSPGAAELD